MAKRLDHYFDRAIHRRALRRWSDAAKAASDVDLPTLKSLRQQARQVRRRIDQLIYIADSRLALPVMGSNAIQKPLHCDWAYRPEIWRGPITPAGIASVENKTPFSGEATVFHDCAISELTLRQLRNSRERDLAPFGLRMDVFRFDGSFLSLAIELPQEAIDGLKRKHLIRMQTVVETEKPLEIFARLNIRHGPNTENVVRELPLGSDEVMVEFDLAYTKMNEKRVEKIWIDLIFEGPEMNQIILRDVTFSRRPRAEI
jgi:hypothetical protein